MKSPLSYKILTPSGSGNGKTYPALYLLHGIGSNEEDILPLVELVKEDFILISIRGFYDREDGYSHYQIEGFGQPVRKSFEQSIDRLTKMIEYCKQTYPINPAFQYVLGFSQGASLAMTLALTIGDQLKGIIALSGYMPSFVRDMAPNGGKDVSVYISHGLYDPLFPMREAKANERFFQERGNKTRFVTYLSRHEVTEENQQDFIRWLYEDLRDGSNG